MSKNYISLINPKESIPLNQNCGQMIDYVGDFVTAASRHVLPPINYRLRGQKFHSNIVESA